MGCGRHHHTVYYENHMDNIFWAVPNYENNLTLLVIPLITLLAEIKQHVFV
jgi:hypothetical protein